MSFLLLNQPSPFYSKEQITVE